MAHRTAAQTAVGATICAPTDRIALTAPTSDSVVTNPDVQLTGTVNQASQIEVRIDDAFDGIIPLNLGQKSFTDTVQIPEGTHTIKVTAVNTCSGSNSSDSVVLTFTPPPIAPSTGSTTETSVGTGSELGVTAPSQNGDVPRVNGNSNGGNVAGGALNALGDIANWLNINTPDHPEAAQGSISRMTIARAAVVTAGMTVTVLGLAGSALRKVANLSVMAHAMSGASPTVRIRVLSWGARVVGFAITLGSLFL